VNIKTFVSTFAPSLLTVVATCAFSDLHAFGKELTPMDLLEEKLKPFKACFIEENEAGVRVIDYHKELADERLSPCSTFKIMNSMIGLETGVLKDQDHFIKWDGVRHDIEPWNHDQTLASAVKESVVWYFQKVAKEIGPERMQHYLNLVGYGNGDISGGITKFWLESTLKISAIEQLTLMRRLHTSKLPFSPRTLDITRNLIHLKHTDKGDLFAKTGSGTGGKPFESNEVCSEKQLGWFVGYVVSNGKAHYFACNMIGPGAFGKKARAITEDVLAAQGLL
jgi:beta-lactamase class D